MMTSVSRGSLQFKCLCGGTSNFFVRRSFAADVQKQASNGHEDSRHFRLVGPAVRNLLEQYEIAPEKLRGTGAKGHLLKGDVLSFIQSHNLRPVSKSIPLPEAGTGIALKEKPSTPSGKPGPKDNRGRIKYFDMPVSKNVSAVASALVKGKTAVPHAYLYATCTVDEALKVFANKKGLETVTLTEIVAKSVIAAAKSSPAMLIGHEGKISEGFSIGLESYKNDVLQFRLLKSAVGLNVKEIAKFQAMPEKDEADSSQVPFRIMSLIGSKLDQITESLTSSQSWVVSAGDALKRIDAKTKASSNIITLSLTYNSALISESDAAEFLEKIKKSIERPVFILIGGAAGSPKNPE